MLIVAFSSTKSDDSSVLTELMFVSIRGMIVVVFVFPRGDGSGSCPTRVMLVVFLLPSKTMMGAVVRKMTVVMFVSTKEWW